MRMVVYREVKWLVLDGPVGLVQWKGYQLLAACSTSVSICEWDPSDGQATGCRTVAGGVCASAAGVGAVMSVGFGGAHSQFFRQYSILFDSFPWHPL